MIRRSVISLCAVTVLGLSLLPSSAVSPPKRIVSPSVRSTGAASPPRPVAGEAIAVDACACT
jgi:hypothetical protein